MSSSLKNGTRENRIYRCSQGAYGKTQRGNHMSLQVGGCARCSKRTILYGLARPYEQVQSSSSRRFISKKNGLVKGFSPISQTV